MALTRATPLHLRPWTGDDLPAVLDALASPDMDRQFPKRDTDEARAQAWLDWATGLTARPAGFAFAVCGEDDRPVGNVAAANVDAHDVAWVSYWTGPRGLGIAAAALAGLVPWLHDAASIARLELGHRRNNPASGKVAERAGFLHEGAERGKLAYDGQRYDTLRWARLAGDPRAEPDRPVEIRF
ncbi:GNAT family protein [Glycomyces sp. NPDC046736]|uniref:GNAT family N-acetyltransferase n=1 Tax=Glycomyces sp. NPDC046736 TaxID=3155615 RepID=UPI0033E056E1